ncbi:MAG: multifunctional CCA addition/repair protein [Gammaproteobacteria bacterium]|nr:multifunctional CCA addition/repair protein [Gammaproteobacteria bacterium]MCP4088532.1 multifunctional CCA addition/repair protein [Gammaproteobacteria bacterium]MCP4276728.1 multifunctional CCA addition/repair protein [Gammaproteobacteria bacterium]MCP4832437.1 multifunctional CCA addition/repair protein [Gammaproteobacteria bacterium]MCP4929878.1 multifunctional CCA addition/repair protein [Gammaproteobacteria bacterium]
MDIYLVGGAVRDKLLNREFNEQDWVVVGGTVEALEKLGYRKVGKSFPVFLHPDSGEEYALARTETKIGRGYHGFEVYAGTDVTLEEDLQRRDLTINAIAVDSDGSLIDPWGGQADIDARILRHVSNAFREDPLRVLRIARFAASLHDMGFSIAPETMLLMREITTSGEIAALTPERIWKETEKALSTRHPDIYLQTLRDCGALQVIFPEIDVLFGIPQPKKWHPEIDTGIHVLMVMQMAAKLSDSIAVRFAAMVHDLGKGTTKKEWWPSHRDHERRGAKLIKQLSKRLGIPNNCRDLAVQVAQFHTHVHRALELRPDTVMRVLQEADAFRRPERFEEFLITCEADARGRTGMEDTPYHQADIMRAAFTAATTVNNAAIKAQGLEGPAFGEALKTLRTTAVAEALQSVRSSANQDPNKKQG